LPSAPPSSRPPLAVPLKTASSADVPPVVAAAGLARRFAGRIALAGVDLTVAPGERVALLGPNGAGKTTLLRLIATAIRPDAGSLRVCGLDALRERRTACALIGMVGHQTLLYPDLTARENLRYYGRLYSVSGIEDRATTVLQAVALEPVADRPVGSLSRGMQQRVSLARAIMHSPRLLLLDEPETGLDSAAQEALLAIAERWGREGGAVLVATHRWDWVASFTDRAVHLERGQVVAGRPDH
jgi:heme ABC exporter ATP-binding subunit CcmA